MVFFDNDKEFFIKLEVILFLIWFFRFLEVIYELVGILFVDKCLRLFFKDINFVLIGL